LLVWSFNLHQKQNSVTASLSFAALPICNAIDFLCWFACLFCVALQFQAKQLFKPLPLGVCGGFANAIDFPLCVCFVCGFLVPSETTFKPLPLCLFSFPLCLYLFGVLIYIKNKTA